MHYFFNFYPFRTCYIAPERFKTRSTSLSSSPPGEGGVLSEQNPHVQLMPDGVTEVGEVEKGDLLPSMDIFSAGLYQMKLYNVLVNNQ